jgi:23S rRNA (adenine2503-C2)-methyltransferase
MKLINDIESSDGTRKFLVELDDKNKIECVAIFHKRTICACVSSQVGCAMNCSFCATGKMGFKRNLSSDEILSQLDLIEEKINQKITNVVFMGMGEPLNNYESVIESIKKMNERGFSWKKITVSTVGIPDKIVQLGKDSKCRLAISLHAPNDILRSKLVPANKAYSISEVINACKQFSTNSHNPIMIEYVLIKDVNDNCAEELCDLLKALPYVMVNLIPCNPGEFLPPSEATIEAFKKVLVDAGYKTIIRTQKGIDSSAACGMLATKDL